MPGYVYSPFYSPLSDSNARNRVKLWVTTSHLFVRPLSRRCLSSKWRRSSSIYEVGTTRAGIYMFADSSLAGRTKPHAVGYWRDPANCRKFLEDFAKANNFSHLDLESWKKVRKNHLKDFGVCFFIKKSFHGSVGRAIGC